MFSFDNASGLVALIKILRLFVYFDIDHEKVSEVEPQGVSSWRV